MSSKKEEKLRRKHEKSLTRASTASGGDGTTSSTQTKATRETRKLSDLKNPSNMTVDERREDELGLRKRARDEETAHPSQLVAARADQNRASLGARVNRVGGGEEPEAGEPSDLFQKLFRVNTEMYKKRNDQAFPLERLVGMGLLSSQLQTLDERQALMAAQSHADVDFMAAQLQQLHVNTALPPRQLQQQQQHQLEQQQQLQPASKKKKKNTEDATSSSVVKLDMIFGPLNYPFGYEKRQTGEKRDHVFGAWDREAAERQAAFFHDDQLEQETPFCLRPTQYKMFRELQTRMTQKYRERDRLMADASRQMPRVDLEEVAREYITEARYRPRDGMQTCFNGQLCLFYTFSSDPNARYVGRAFYTPAQRERMKRGEAIADNAEGLCIDCLLKKWTQQHDDNVRKEFAPRTCFNHFTVLVGPGQYSAAAMLTVVSNKRPTGVVGCVPRYDPRKRDVATVVRRIIDRQQQVVPLRESFVCETGLDF